MAELRIATFNLENWDETLVGERPSLSERIALVKPQIRRLWTDVVCFQEVNGHERPNQPRALLALAELLASTDLEGASVACTRPGNDGVYNEHNLVVVSRLPVLAFEQPRNSLVD